MLLVGSDPPSAIGSGSVTARGAGLHWRQRMRTRRQARLQSSRMTAEASSKVRLGGAERADPHCMYQDAAIWCTRSGHLIICLSRWTARIEMGPGMQTSQRCPAAALDRCKGPWEVPASRSSILSLCIMEADLPRVTSSSVPTCALALAVMKAELTALLDHAGLLQSVVQPPSTPPAACSCPVNH